MVSMLLGCQSGSLLMTSETPPHCIQCVCVPKVERVGFTHQTPICSDHRTIRLKAVDKFIQSQSQSVNPY